MNSTSTHAELDAKKTDIGGSGDDDQQVVTNGEKRVAPRRSKRSRKLSGRVMMFIRRVHLFSGLFMLPWVLLYGFTALLFNHPTVMSGSKTKIQSFELQGANLTQLPSAEALAKLAVETAQQELNTSDVEQSIELAEDPRAMFTRQLSGSVENEQENVRLVLDLNSGKGYLRKTSKGKGIDEEGDSEAATLEDGLKFSLAVDPTQAVKSSTDSLLSQLNLESGKLNVRGIPNIEFDAIVDGERKRLRLSQAQDRNRGRSTPKSGDRDQPKPAEYKGQLSIIGSNPRDMNARSFLLRLHMAHGYPIVKNSRWFWAIAVDLMFASMVFWGLSGVFMWWQIKRTRRIGLLLLVGSAVIATVLAIGMHWQLAHG